MFGRRNNFFMYAAIAAVAGYFFKDKLPASLQSIYQKIEDKLKS
ncbi:hypothetical protein B0I27_109104 [Arcticibacter pallidicorallinus]|uniref:Uncharacterized protein n=1 Tax=Arcticibacter pallidicorallinus TaxID=1259464 RepID=A0A2T0TXJ0_9SPHI|nr:hypothetical protein B0I27_109104 [Arcticibacter pallidicorallinus]